MFTGSGVLAAVEVAGEPTIGASGGEDVHELFKMSRVT